MTTLLEAHFEIVHALVRLVLLNALLVDGGATVVDHAALVLAHVVQLVATHRKVGFRVAIALENFVGFLLTKLHGSLFFLARVLVDETLLGSGLRHFVVLLRKIGLSQLVHELKSSLFCLRVESAIMVLEVVPVLRNTIKRAVAQRPVALPRDALRRRLLWVPLLPLSISIELAAAQLLVGRRVSKLEVRRLHLGCLVLARLFRDILAHFLGLLSGLGRMVTVALLLSHILLRAIIALAEGVRAVDVDDMLLACSFLCCCCAFHGLLHQALAILDHLRLPV